jgi:predicted transcriptional regulator
VKTAISIPDDVFRRAERLAKKRNVSRSQLYTTALVHLLEGEPMDEVTRAYDSAFAEDNVDPFTRDAARLVLAGIEWSDE